VNSLVLTEKQQEVLWFRYGRRASINQIAVWLKISRRAVLSRLRNARRRAARAGSGFPEEAMRPSAAQKFRTYPASQISDREGGGVMRLDDL
jgi:hypothetical protein